MNREFVVLALIILHKYVLVWFRMKLLLPLYIFSKTLLADYSRDI